MLAVREAVKKPNTMLQPKKIPKKIPKRVVTKKRVAKRPQPRPAWRTGNLPPVGSQYSRKQRDESIRLKGIRLAKKAERNRQPAYKQDTGRVKAKTPTVKRRKKLD